MEFQTSIMVTPEILQRSNKLFQRKLKREQPIGHAPYYIMLLTLTVLCLLALHPHFPDLIPTAISYLAAAFVGYVVAMTMIKHQAVKQDDVMQEEVHEKSYEIKCLYRDDSLEVVTPHCRSIYPWASVTEIVHDDYIWLLFVKPNNGVFLVNSNDVSDGLRALLKSKVATITNVEMPLSRKEK